MTRGRVCALSCARGNAWRRRVLSRFEERDRRECPSRQWIVPILTSIQFSNSDDFIIYSFTRETLFIFYEHSTDINPPCGHSTVCIIGVQRSVHSVVSSARLGPRLLRSSTSGVARVAAGSSSARCGRPAGRRQTHLPVGESDRRVPGTRQIACKSRVLVINVIQDN